MGACILVRSVGGPGDLVRMDIGSSNQSRQYRLHSCVQDKGGLQLNKDWLDVSSIGNKEYKIPCKKGNNLGG